MLTQRYFSYFCSFLSFGCGCKFFPYIWDGKECRLKKGSANQWFYFSIHRTVIVTMLTFSGFRLAQAFTRPGFPLLLKILNIAWVGGYTLALVAFYQWDVNEKEIMQFGNYLLNYADPANKEKREEEKAAKNRGAKAKRKLALPPEEENLQATLRKEEQREERSLGLHLLFGLLLFLGNPGVHTTLVNETPCAPHFTSSLAFPCLGYSATGVPFLHKVPFIVIEYYLICTMFISITFNWAMVYLGMSWVLKEINHFRRDLKHFSSGPEVVEFRGVEVIVSLVNNGFRPYLASFPSLLFFMVSSLVFGVVRLWHTAPLANLMFPLCSTECLYDAVTPLAVAGDISFKTRELNLSWRSSVASMKGVSRREKKMLMLHAESYNGVRVTSGHFFTFENTIVLVCMHNCIQLTLNMLVTFNA